MQLRSDSMMHRSRVSSGGRAGQDSNLTSNNRGYTTDSGHVTATVQNTTATAADDVSLTQAVAPVQSSALTPLEHTTLDTL